MPFDYESLQDILVCPRSRSKLVLDGESLVCADPECRLRYAIRDGIPIMLIDEATELPVEEWSAIMERHGHQPA